jgi:hypothetical protein
MNLKICKRYVGLDTGDFIRLITDIDGERAYTEEEEIHENLVILLFVTKC